jgi:hypothetical protein
MMREGQSRRREPSNAAEPVPENKPAPPRLDLQSAPYPLTHTYLPGVHFPLRG